MAIQQYLDNYAEQEVDLLGNFNYQYNHVLCIPAFAEQDSFLEPMLARTNPESLLVILVANASEHAAPEKLSLTQNLVTTLLKKYLTKQSLSKNIHLLSMDDEKDLLLIDCCNPGFFIDEKSGVGLARKIACDIACQLIAKGNIHSQWIHSTDADAILPEDYFQATLSLDDSKTSAGIYPFQHIDAPDEKTNMAQQLYDLSLHYYVAGLAWAGSAWAYHTIGSTIVINALHYARARGFPKRQAGEDFYLLNKLAKTGEISQLPTTPLRLQCRVSDRVPFGTGPAVMKIVAMENPQSEFLYYEPQCFIYLKCWLELATNLWPEKIRTLSIEQIQKQQDADSNFREIDSSILLECLQSVGADKALEHGFSNSRSKVVFDRHLRNWFDGFITLKFIHWLRDNHLPSVPLSAIQGETNLPFLKHLAADCLADYVPAQQA